MNKYEWKSQYYYVEVESGIVLAKIKTIDENMLYSVNVKNCGDVAEFVDFDKAKNYVEHYIGWKYDE